MKNACLFILNALFLLFLFSCSKSEELEIDQGDEIISESERIMMEAFTHAEFFGNMKKYQTEDCESSCVNDTPSSWVLQESTHAFNAQFWIDLKIYNTPTEIVYAFQIMSRNNSRPVIASLNGQAINMPAYEMKVSKESSWNPCEIIEERFTISRGAGQALLINTSYKLFGTCD
ncbi:hypothetical protein Belba_1214 [Belliella baltica DSM 15883]|uniref:Lipoprotein n=1 Tax=Belliella baltica (strain DSM 15883 / CIP 108006 / LMG 21964 / BA134) TaxID=866536 RepID=I3Z3N1_BELBD|nr:hypothetical protein [Belliella baltica]AFL83849.1 hypothetical protein Belba_1214 [Belliella baltica DSM 15883]